MELDTAIEGIRCLPGAPAELIFDMPAIKAILNRRRHIATC